MTVRIAGATVRDLTFILGNLRPDDFAELDAQMDAWSPELIAAMSLQGPAWVALLHENPEAAFGAHSVRSGQWIAWSYMTRRGWRCVPRVTQFVASVMVPDILAKGGQRVEARALATNESARRWLKKLGAHEDCILENYGKGGEHFVLYSWSRDRHGLSLTDGGCHLLPQAAQAAATPEDSATRRRCRAHAPAA